MAKQILSKAFFGKDNCLKVYLNDKKECYFEFGSPKTSGDAWNWKSVKFSDVELGELIGVIDGHKEKVNFFHSFQGGTTQVWVRKIGDKLSIKTKELTKGLTFGEQMVLRELLSHMILRTNLQF